MWRVPEKCQRWPLRHEGKAGQTRKHNGDAERNDAEGWLDRQADRLARDDDRVKIWQIVLMRPPYSRKCAVQKQKRDYGKDHKACNLQPHCLPVDVSKTKRLKPEKVNPVRQRNTGGKKYPKTKSDKKEKPAKPPRRSSPQWRINE